MATFAVWQGSAAPAALPGPDCTRCTSMSSLPSTSTSVSGHHGGVQMDRRLPLGRQGWLRPQRPLNGLVAPPHSHGRCQRPWSTPQGPKKVRRGLTPVAAIEERNVGKFSSKEELEEYNDLLADRIARGEYSVAKRVRYLSQLRQKVAALGPWGRAVAKLMADLDRQWRALTEGGMPEARGDIREIVGQPVFIPLYKLFLLYGGVFRLSFGVKSFVVVSDPEVARHILAKNAKNYTKGILSEILDFVMGKGLIPADGEIWRTRRRAIGPALHKQYVAAMVKLFGQTANHLCGKLEAAQVRGEASEMESLFSRMALDVIGKAVFNYEFDSLTTDKGIVEAVYTLLKEAEYRSVAVVPYWKVAPLRWIVPRQRKVSEALMLMNDTLDELINVCKRIVEEEGDVFFDEYVNDRDPSILHFLLASGDQVDSRQLRDDLMTLLIAGHETSAAVLTWSFYMLSQHPDKLAKLQEEVDRVLGDRWPTIEDMRQLKYTMRIINETMRLYPAPPILIRRSIEPDNLGGFKIGPNQDIFISTWNLHHSPIGWERVEEFWPERWPLDAPTPNELTENYNYLPFGGGQRKCVGDQFALFEAIVTMSMVVRRFDPQLAPNAPPVRMTTGATIHTTEGLHMIFPPRKNKGPPVGPVLRKDSGAAGAAGAAHPPGVHAAGSGAAAPVNGASAEERDQSLGPAEQNGGSHANGALRGSGGPEVQVGSGAVVAGQGGGNGCPGKEVEVPDVLEPVKAV